MRSEGLGGLALAVPRPAPAVLVADDPGGRGVGRERRRQHHRTRARPAAAVRRREGLVQVDVHGVDAEVAGAHPADDGVEVGAVAVEVGARRVGQPADLEDVALEQAAGVGVGDHDRRDVGRRAWPRGRRGRPGRRRSGRSRPPCSRRRRRWPGWCRGRWSAPAPSCGGPGRRPRGRRGWPAGRRARRGRRPWGTAPPPACRSGSSASAPGGPSAPGRPARSTAAAAGGCRRSPAGGPSSR
jgi:hypothetical protein